MSEYQTGFSFVVCTGIMGLICLLNTVDGEAKLQIDLSYNSLICDCKDYAIISINRYYVRSHQLDRANCEEPPSLYRAKVQY